MENTIIISNQFRAEVEQLAEKFVNTYNRGDARGIAAFYSAKGMVLPPNSNIVEGSQQIESFWQALMNLGAKNIKLQVLEAEQYDDTAYEVGRATILSEGNQTIDDIKYVVIWKRENGDWKIYRDIFNSNNPVQPA
jgi:uncharacterized protein (TIGR02246 family)